MNKSIMVVLVFSSILVANVFLVFSGYKYSQSWDSRWAIYTAMSIVKTGNTDLDEYKDIIDKNYNHSVHQVNNHYYDNFPIGASIFAVPFMVSLNLFSDQVGENLSQNLETSIVCEFFIASTIVALTAVFIYLIGSIYLNKRYSLLLVFIFAFCTSAWSTATNALWRHAPSMLMLSIALYLILLARDKPKIIQFVSIPLTFSFVISPTNIISIAMLTLYVFIQYRDYFVKCIIWATPVVLTFLIYNFLVYSSLLAPYYKASKKLFGNPVGILEAMAGNLISPSRGLFIFSPVLLFSLLGFLLKVKDRQIIKLDYFILAIVFLHLIVISTPLDWWGGWSFGNRYFSDMMPYFMYFMIPFLVRLPRLAFVMKSFVATVFILVVLFSFFVNFRGTADGRTWNWNDHMNLGMKENAILWDWSDLQFFAGL